MNKPLYPTRPCAKAPAMPDVPSHHDIDWRKVSVAAAIDEEREHYRAMRERIEAARKSKPSMWSTLLQVLGVRRVTP